MKKALVCISMLLILTLIFCACSSSSKPNELPSSSVPSSLPPVEVPPSSISNGAASSSIPAGKTDPLLYETEAIETSIGLYKDGYLTFMSVIQGADVDPTQSIKVSDETYYRHKLYETRAALESALGQAFTPDFVQRNVAGFFDGSNYPHMVEQDGILYSTLLDGIGGTYELATDTTSIDNFSASGWTFTMNAYDMWEQKASEEQWWTIDVVNRNGSWLIDSMHMVFSDGSGDTSY